jgi:hypothetical protein
MHFPGFRSIATQTPVNVEEPRFIEFVAKEGKTVEQFVAELIGTHLVARDGNRLCLTTIHCGIVQAPNGDIFAGEDNTGLLTKWAEKQIGKPISQWNILVIRLGEDDSSRINS